MSVQEEKDIDLTTVTEEQIYADALVRKKIIKTFNSKANKYRKYEAYKAYECLKDRTKNYVLEQLLKQFDAITVEEMKYSISNLSILRKVIDKLAKVYANGAIRKMPQPETKPDIVSTGSTPKPQVDENGDPLSPDPNAQPDENATPPAQASKPGAPPVDPNLDPAAQAEMLQEAIAVGDAKDEETKKLEKLAKILDLDRVMVKANRYFKVFRNTLVYARPQIEDDGKYSIKLEVKPPFRYDVVENPQNREEALAIVLSDYKTTRETMYTLGDAATALRGRIGIVKDLPAGQVDLTPQGTITEKQTQDEVKDTRQFIWWTKGYHFTTDANGEIIESQYEDPEDVGKNPIARLPFVNLCADQDGCFFAEGGEDLIDSGVKINTLITNADHIGVTQGYGQLYMTGKDLPKSFKTGPNHCVQLEHQGGDEPVPTIGFLQSAPPLAELKSQIEMNMALFLVTNNLSVSGFSVSLDSSKSFASGVALLIDKSESIEDIDEQAQLFIKKEPQVLDVVAAWHDVYSARDLLTEEWGQIQIPKDVKKEEVSFPPATPILSEADEIAVLTSRKALGLNTMAELMMRDDPSLTLQSAQQKLKLIQAEKTANAQLFMAQTGMTPGGPPNGDQSQKGSGNGKSNDIQSRLGPGQPSNPGVS